MRYLDSHLDNHNPGLGGWLQDRLPDAEIVGVRSGFLTITGVEAVAAGLRDVLACGGQVTVVAGGHGEQVDVAALAALHDLMSPYPESAALRVVCEPFDFLNAKTYYVRDSHGATHALVGSPNLTYGGLESNAEAAVVFTSDTDDPDVIQQVWEGIRASASDDSSEMVTAETLIKLGNAQRGNTGRAQPVQRLAKPSLPLSDLMQPTLDEIEAVGENVGDMTGLPTGFCDLDRLLNGLHPGDLITVAGRPGIGKSTLLLDFTRHISLHHEQNAAFLSFENTAVALSHRLLAAETRVPLHVLRSGQLSDDDWTRLARRMGEISAAPLFINDAPNPGIDAICQELESLHRNFGLRLAVIDSLPLIIGDRITGLDRYHLVGEVVRRLKRQAHKLGIPIVISAQLKAQNRVDSRPVLTDIAESEVINQVADVVILLHRDDYYDRDSPRAGEADLVVAKHRNGSTDTVTVAAQLHLSRFVDMAV